mmetsp:Transcript_16565/g.29969  ORF Transcript_16565/g.29969 Transcript_16565/m.29969 type:complete len:87 (-) Transcript_16565:587-847(-)
MQAFSIHYALRPPSITRRSADVAFSLSLLFLVTKFLKTFANLVAQLVGPVSRCSPCLCKFAAVLLRLHPCAVFLHCSPKIVSPLLR